MATTKKTNEKAEKGKKVALPAQPATAGEPAAETETAAAQPETTAPAAESNSTDAAFAQMYEIMDNEPGRMIGVAVRYITTEGQSLAGQIVGHDKATGLTSIWIVTPQGQQRITATYHRTDKRKPAEHSCWEVAGMV